MKLIVRDSNTAYLDTWLWVPKPFLNVDGTKKVLSPEFSGRDGPRVVPLWKETPTHLLMPRAFWPVTNLPYRTVDLRPASFPKVDIRSTIKLDHRTRIINGEEKLMPTGNDLQRRALAVLLKANGGILQLACGKGKTCIALEMSSILKRPTLIVVPDTQLLQQWQKEIAKLMVVPDGVGLIQGPKFDWHKPIVMTTYHTIGARALELPEEVLRWFGLVIWDEGHHIPAPTFAASAEAFYGIRLALTATPERDDGLHIISEYHIGPILFKDLTQDLKPTVFFKWTGLTLDDQADKEVRSTSNEIHLGLLSSYYGKWLARMAVVLSDVEEAVKSGRKVLVISNSVDEIVNLASMWTAGDWYLKKPSLSGKLYTDIPEPTLADIGETIPPQYFPRDQAKLMKERIEDIDESLLLDPSLDAPAVQGLNAEKASLEIALHQYKVHKMLTSEMRKRQRTYVDALLQRMTNCGIMIYDIKPKLRQEFIETRPVVFAIAKYSREGLDSPRLDTVLVSTPFSQKNILQQTMGREARLHDEKHKPVLVFYEDNIGPIIGMCTKLRQHLRRWPHEEGGPFEYELVDHPKTARKKWTPKMIFGQ